MRNLKDPTYKTVAAFDQSGTLCGAGIERFFIFWSETYKN